MVRARLRSSGCWRGCWRATSRRKRRQLGTKHSQNRYESTAVVRGCSFLFLFHFFFLCPALLFFGLFFIFAWFSGSVCCLFYRESLECWHFSRPWGVVSRIVSIVCLPPLFFILISTLFLSCQLGVPSLNVSYKPQKISPKFQGTVRQLLHKRIREAYIHPQVSIQEHGRARKTHSAWQDSPWFRYREARSFNLLLE